MKTTIFYLMLCIFFISFQLKAQEYEPAPVQTDVISIGLGFGQDYGGFGVHMIVYPQQNIGIFGGLGSRLDDLGYNVGVKFRLVSQKPTAKVNPYAIAMYGYNAAFVVGHVLSAYLHSYDKLFYGPTIGVGIDLKFKPRSKFYYSFGLNLPVRGSQVDDYINDLRTNYGLDVTNDLPPVTFSVGLKYSILSSKTKRLNRF